MNIIEQEKLIVILRGVKKEQLPQLLPALYDGGVRLIEIAFNHSDPNTVDTTCALIREAKRVMGDRMYVGAGTVLNAWLVAKAHEAGAQFIFSPNTKKEVIQLTKQLGMLSIPGAYTPTECVDAYDAGADAVKLFPITKDDVGYVKNITRPLSHIPFLCVGGVSPETIPLYLEAGAVGVGTGISILKPELLEAEDYAAIRELAARHVAACAAQRKEEKA